LVVNSRWIFLDPRWHVVVTTVCILQKSDECVRFDILELSRAFLGFDQISIHERSEGARRGSNGSRMDHEWFSFSTDVECEQVGLDQAVVKSTIAGQMVEKNLLCE
jgi:hypothetical protein